MTKKLIAYFSRADENYFGGAIRYIEVGNTEIVVNKIAEMMEADIFKIEMKTPNSKVKKGLSLIGSEVENSDKEIENWLKVNENKKTR
ncbi:MAG: hypothetical protein SPJ36_06490 [Peptostreptococcus porci]|nr:hypothetical protein [Peptostreptococcus porci]